MVTEVPSNTRGREVVSACLVPALRLVPKMETMPPGAIPESALYDAALTMLRDVTLGRCATRLSAVHTRRIDSLGFNKYIIIAYIRSYIWIGAIMRIFMSKSSDSEPIPVPESVPVPDNSSFVRVTVKTKAVTTEKEVTITASYPGGNHSHTITLKP